MRICIATSSYPSQGENSFAGAFARDFARELASRGNRVTVFTQETGNPSFKDDGIDVVPFRWPGEDTPISSLRPYRPLDVWKIYVLLEEGKRRLLRHCIKGKVDLLFALWTLPAGYWGTFVKKRLGTPLAVWSLGSDIWVYGRLPLFKLWIRDILRRSDFRFADGFSLTREIETLSGRPCSFLPTTRILPKEEVPDLTLDPQKSHFLFIGRYHPNKGPDLLLEAIRRIDTGTLSKLRFDFFGKGPLEAGLRSKVSELGLEGQVAIRGPVDSSMMAALLRQCHCLIIPSRIESIPVILSDALQADCRLIVTDVGDMGPLVRSHHAGRVVDPGSPERLKDAILGSMVKEKDEFREGRKKLYALFDLKGSVDTFLKAIEYSFDSSRGAQ